MYILVEIDFINILDIFSIHYNNNYLQNHIFPSGEDNHTFINIDNILLG